MNAVAPIELPQHVAEGGEWKDWPLKLGAHLTWGVRQRQIEAFTRNGKLKVYVCPDDSKRLDPDALREMFGEPGILQGRDRDLTPIERKAKQEAAALATADPTVLMFRAAVDQMNRMFDASISLIKVVEQPLNTLLSAYQKTIDSQNVRIAVLEKRADEADAMRSELADASQERELGLRRHEASERRRDQTLTLLKDQVPEVMKAWLEGSSLSAFAKRTPKDVIAAMIESDAISDQDVEILCRGAGIPKPQPKQEANPNMNGAASHGHS